MNTALYKPEMTEMISLGFRSNGVNPGIAVIGPATGWSIYYTARDKVPFCISNGRQQIKLQIHSKEELMTAIRIFDIGC